jgi:hypothetical protein
VGLGSWEVAHEVAFGKTMATFHNGGPSLLPGRPRNMLTMGMHFREERALKVFQSCFLGQTLRLVTCQCPQSIHIHAHVLLLLFYFIFLYVYIRKKGGGPITFGVN